MTLESLRMTIKETLPRINMTLTIGLNPVESDILEPSNHKIGVVDKFPRFYKLVPIAGNTRFLLVPLPLGVFKSAQTPGDMISSISGAVQSAANSVKVVKGVKLIQECNLQVPADGTPSPASQCSSSPQQQRSYSQ
ncbi:uncharacterized protein LOC123722634 [Papilio machaon]|uniref:uncharacterized protein LOC123722634 n=1 Tax=Papilio machaon TaxID=76193 RepID=UPI001E6649B5|nr:uncharacterized protein LOC123722634 [Papilio machaon]